MKIVARKSGPAKWIQIIVITRFIEVIFHCTVIFIWMKDRLTVSKENPQIAVDEASEKRAEEEYYAE